MHHRIGRTLKQFSTASLLLAASQMLCACNGTANWSPSAREVSLAEFSQSHSERTNDRLITPERDDQAIDAQPERSTRVRLEASTPPGSRADIESRPSQHGQPRRVVVDSMVGQVNGRPIYANAFFAPLEDQLRALRRQTNDREFAMQAERIIREHLGHIVTNELFLAEAESQLTSEQQQGIFAWMRHMRDVTIAQGGGTRAGTGQRLQDREGMTIDEYIAMRRDAGLIQQLQREKVAPRVIVAWRDVEREYQRRWSEFNPPATLTLARIRLSTRNDGETIQEVSRRIADGEPFAEVAQSLGQERDGTEWQTFQMGAGGIDDISLADPIKQHISGLEVGQTSEAFEQGSSTWWLHIANIEQPPGRDLYDPDVQRQISTMLQNRRFNEEMNRYIGILLDQGIADEAETMHRRLLEIAIVRYGR